MRFKEIVNLAEAERVPYISDLWQHSDELSPEENERAKDAAYGKIDAIRRRNNADANERRGDRKNFQLKSFESFGINLPVFMKDYCDSMYDFLVANPSDIPHYVGSMEGVTPDSVYDALIRQKGGSDAKLDVVLEALITPGPDVEDKYEVQLKSFHEYRRMINRLGPIGKQKALDVLKDQIRAVMP